MKSMVCCQQCKVDLCGDCFRPYHLQTFIGMFKSIKLIKYTTNYVFYIIFTGYIDYFMIILFALYLVVTIICIIKFLYSHLLQINSYCKF